jgi:hypothetical protein
MSAENRAHARTVVGPSTMLIIFFKKNYAYQFHPLVTIEAHSNFYLREDSV